MATRSNNSATSGGHPTSSSSSAGRDPEGDLKASLDAFETALATPVVAGELGSWADSLQEIWSKSASQIHFHIKHLHPRQYEAIAKQDPELLPRTEQLRTEDEAIEAQREQINHAVARVAAHAPKLEPDEEKAQKHIRRLIADGIAFVTRVRKQSVAVQTWYVEAFNRDSGAVD